MNPPLDGIDRAILAELRADARLPVAKLAQRVQVSESTANRRLHALVKTGVIKQFTTVEDTSALGHDTEALITIKVKDTARGNLRSFYEFLCQRPEIVHTYFVAGTNDFVVHAAVPSARELRDFISDSISSHPDVASTNTALIFEHSTGG